MEFALAGPTILTYCRVNPRSVRDDAELAVVVDGLQVNLHEYERTLVFQGFRRVFDVSSGQEDVYTAVYTDLDFSSMLSLERNAMILAYGQTGAGKTHTILGNPHSQEQMGLIPFTIRGMFSQLASLPTEVHEHIKISISYISLYNEEIWDLLDESHKKPNLNIKESAERGVYIEGLIEKFVVSADEAVQALQQGQQSTMMFTTRMEISTSRMFTLFTLVVHKNCAVDESKSDIPLGTDTTPRLPMSKVTLVDMAGSERRRAMGSSATVLRESAMISRSLSALGTVICAFVENAEGKKCHIPFRDSKLTRLLQPALTSANASIAVIGCITRWQRDVTESISTLRFLKTCQRAGRPKMLATTGTAPDGVTSDSAALSAREPGPPPPEETSEAASASDI